MTSEQNITEQESLGDYLRKTRLDRGLDIEQISNETKIPASIIRAMENDDHALLPAPAFSRGFYHLYAKTLSIKQEELLKRCKDTPNHPLNDSKPQSPQHLKYDATNLAQKPPLPFFSIFAGMLVLLFVAFAAICWFFSWNPAEYLSKQLRKLDTSQPQIEQTTEQTFVTPEEPVQTQPSIAIQQAPSEPIINQPEAQVLPVQKLTDTEPILTGYKLEGTFAVQTDLTITVDDGRPEKMKISAGETKIWNAAQSIVIELESTSGVKLNLNEDIPITLPQGQTATIAIPEYFFE